MLKVATDKDFKEKVLENDKVVLVDFYAHWCGPCLMQVPVLEELANSRGSDYDIVRVNVDEERRIASSYEINTIPTLMIFKGGKVQKKRVGFTNKETIKDMMNE